MAGIDFDRQAFVPAAERAPRPTSRVLAPLILVIAVAALGVVGFKLLSEYSRSAPGSDSQGLEQIQQQLAGMEKRIDQLEKRRKVSSPEPANISSKPESHDSTVAPPLKRPTYRISSAIAPQAEAMPNRPPDPIVQPSTSRLGSSSAEDSAAANHEAWQATTDRLADVVGVVGSQQGELSQAREDLNRLLAQTRRSALQFELRRGKSREPVGPVSLLLKASDPKTQRYTVCVYLENQCLELKDRVMNEVVVFVLHRNSAPLELVATKVLRDQIVGYLEIPIDNIGP
jgi:hypothetical protein